MSIDDKLREVLEKFEKDSYISWLQAGQKEEFIFSIKEIVRESLPKEVELENSMDINFFGVRSDIPSYTFGEGFNYCLDEIKKEWE